MSTSFCLVDGSISLDESRLRIAKGFHGLHHYANDFWTEHLLQYAKLQDISVFTKPTALIDELEKLLQFRKESLPAIYKSELLYVKTLPAITTRLVVLDKIPRIRSLVYEVLTFWEILTLEKHTQKDPDGKYSPP